MYQLGNYKERKKQINKEKRIIKTKINNNFMNQFKKQVEQLSNSDEKEKLDKLFLKIKQPNQTKQEILKYNKLWNDCTVPLLPLERNYFKITDKKYNIDNLKNDLKTAILNMDTSWVNKGEKWKSITLKSEKGDEQSFLRKSFLGIGKNNCYKYTKAMKNCEYFKKILEEIPTDIYLVRILKLEERGIIGYHTDDEVFKEKTKIIRCHIPIVTHPNIEFGIGFPISKRPHPNKHPDNPDKKEYRALDLDKKHLEAGNMYYTNVNTLHAVYNPTNIARYHLCIDMRPPEFMIDLLNK